MLSIELKQVKHDYKIGTEVGTIQPNVKEDCIFTEDRAQPIGFYVRSNA